MADIGALPSDRLRWRVVMALTIGAILVSFASVTRLGQSFHLGAYLLVNYLLFADLFDLVLRNYFVARHTGSLWGRGCPTSVPVDVGRFTDAQIKLHIKPYAFLLSVRNLGNEVEDFIEEMLPFRERMWIVDDASTDGTSRNLLRAGFHCVEEAQNRNKPGAIQQLLRRLGPEIETVIIMDPDCRFTEEVILAGGLERRIFEFQRSRMAALTPRVRIRDAGVLPALQALEYGVTFSVLRKSLGDHCVTSGVAIYRRDALESALEKHDLSIYAEDLENAVILLSERERIYYDERLVFETSAEQTWGGLFSQRVGWYFGLINVYASQFPRIRSFWRRDASRAYHFLVYQGVVAILLHPIRLLMWGMLLLSTLNSLDYLLGLDWIPDTPVTHPGHFLIAYLQYTAFMALLTPLAIHPSERGRLAPAIPLFFFYQLALVLPNTVGYLNWLSLRLFGRRVYRDRFDSPESGDSAFAHP